MSMPARKVCEDGGAAFHLADFIDFAHLERYTMGEPQLTEELLSLFCAEVRAFRLTGDAVAQRQAVHRLKGAARAIGAFPLADAAAWLEELLHAAAPEEDLRDARLDLMARLEALKDACQRWKQAVHG